ncbi:MAG: TetR/AcrR family transcriptional regulator [Acetobacteraceae bacterium]|nr:TetR/AcrR family transcriptional regulator [Acetobacteraceae bacterium]
MEEGTATERRAWVIRSGRPPRALAGEVDERILDAARKVFLERGFEGASVDEIADAARAGKPTIYARFPGKEALFTAVMARHVGEVTGSYETIAPTGAKIEERLASIATAILGKILTAETVGLVRATIAEARRFPDLASNVHRMARERGTQAVAQLLSELSQPDEMRTLPAFAAERRPATAQYFTELIVLPLLMRALFGEDLTALRAEIGPHVARTVAFFLAACRHGGVD